MNMYNLQFSLMKHHDIVVDIITITKLYLTLTDFAGFFCK